MSRRDPSRDEHGATAVLVALLALVLLGVGAFAVDMGQVYAKRSALQSNVDMAVMAATAKLDNPGACNPEVIDVATEYLTKPGNEVVDQISVDLTTGGPGGDADGFIKCDNWRVDLWAPRVDVHFGLAKALSDTNDGVEVPAHAAAQIKSPAMSMALPMYGVAGCDYGTQTISDPPPGPTPDTTVPDLIPDTAPNFNAADFTITPTEVASATPAPVSMTLTGTDLGGTTAVGFTTAGGNHFEVTGADLTVSATSVTLTSVPAEVLAKDAVWWVRVFDGSLWSDEQKAQPFTVGDLLFCDGAISGNFGTIVIARTDPNWVLERNIMHGIEPTLALYPDLTATECQNGVSPAITSETTPNDGTNCLGTDPGFPPADGTIGFVTGKGTEKGRLDKPTTPGCSRNGDSSQTVGTPTSPTSVPLNDDLLTCFIVDDTASIQNVVDGEPNILSADILTSPRFFWLPVIPTEAEHGSSNFYPIIDFRPGFITDQPLHATPSAPATSSISAYSGLKFHSNKVSQVNVVLFDEAALPESAPALGGEKDYTGSGPKVIVLVE